MSKEQRKKILRAQYPLTLKLARYVVQPNFVPNLTGRPLELNQNIAQEVEKSKKEKRTTKNDRI
jgi:hypothetical protein